MSTHKQIDEETLNNLLYLSRLSPESTDIATLKKQVDEIVGYFDILSKYDDSENPYDAYPSTEAEKLREDEVVLGLEIPDVKNVSENFMDGYFQVPKVLGEGAQNSRTVKKQTGRFVLGSTRKWLNSSGSEKPKIAEPLKNKPKGLF